MEEALEKISKEEHITNSRDNSIINKKEEHSENGNQQQVSQIDLNITPNSNIIVNSDSNLEGKEGLIGHSNTQPNGNDLKKLKLNYNVDLDIPITNLTSKVVDNSDNNFSKFKRKPDENTKLHEISDKQGGVISLNKSEAPVTPFNPIFQETLNNRQNAKIEFNHINSKESPRINEERDETNNRKYNDFNKY